MNVFVGILYNLIKIKIDTFWNQRVENAYAFRPHLMAIIQHKLKIPLIEATVTRVIEKGISHVMVHGRGSLFDFDSLQNFPLGIMVFSCENIHNVF
jgi:hypothetical protein